MKNLLFLVFSLLWGSNLSFKKDYCRLSATHTICTTNGFAPACGFNPQDIVPSDDDIAYLLLWHNTVRERVASGGAKFPKASNMRKLVWDEELALIAQTWAGNCVLGYDCEECRNVLNGRFHSVGQNIAYAGSMGMPYYRDSSVFFITLVDAWYRLEVENLNENVISSYQAPTNGTYAHFTQVIWAETTAFGCGAVFFKDGRYTNQLVVSNYGEGGKIPGLPIYEAGTPCSACPSGTSCQGSLCDFYYIDSAIPLKLYNFQRENLKEKLLE